MEHPIDTEEYKGYTIDIFPDDSPESPRTAWDNATTMVCFSERYTLGDEHTYNLSEIEDGAADAGLNTWEYLYQVLSEDYTILTLPDSQGGGLAMRPVLHYDYGSNGVSIQLGRDENNMAGFIFVTADNVCGTDAEHALEVMRQDIEVYSQWANGDVYGYVISKPCSCCVCGNEHKNIIDSCWGFYGLEDAIEQAKEAVPTDA